MLLSKHVKSEYIRAHLKALYAQSQKMKKNTIIVVSIGGVMAPTVLHRVLIEGLEEELISFPQNMSD